MKHQGTKFTEQKLNSKDSFMKNINMENETTIFLHCSFFGHNSSEFNQFKEESKNLPKASQPLSER